MPYAEIAKTLGASVPQIKTWIHRARRQLAVALKEFAQT
jgi:DNA-directed RNA polymerase specialized sigma24 family protein